jgi:FkbM family methyltransferase
MRVRFKGGMRRLLRACVMAAPLGLRVRLLRLLLQGFGANVVTLYNQRRNLIISSLDGVLGRILVQGEYQETADIAFVRAAVDADDVVFDVGASIGYYTIIFAELVRHGRGAVYAFEPTPATFARLERNCALNGFIGDKVFLDNRALLDTPGRGQLHCYEEVGHEEISSSGWNTFGVPGFRDPSGREIPTRPVCVDVTSLDQVVSLHGLDTMNMMKLDAEGAEYLVLKGGARTLERCAKTDAFLIMIELEPERLQSMGSTVAEVVNLLEGYGMTICKFDACAGRLVTAEDPSFSGLAGQNGIACRNPGYWNERLARKADTRLQ